MATGRTEPERKLAAILAADVLGYRRLMQAGNKATLAALTESRALFSEKVANHGGRVVNAPGDSILSEFASALTAVPCALEKIEKQARSLRPKEKAALRGRSDRSIPVLRN